MKKRTLLSMLLMLAMMLSLVGCGSDDKKPTSTDTAVNGTEATTDVAEKPTEVETPTPEPEKNVITLMSADGKKIIHEFDIPEGYTVVSDKKSNHVELAKDGDDTIKVEIISGPCAEYLSTYYQYVDEHTVRANETNKYKYSNIYCDSAIQSVGINEYDYITKDELNTEIDKIINQSGIDKKYFTQTFNNMKILNIGYGFATVVEYPKQHSYEILEKSNPEWNSWSDHFDLSDIKEDDTFPVTYYCYNQKNGKNYLSANETFTIKVTTTFKEDKYNELNPYRVENYIIQNKIGDYLYDTNKYTPLKDLLETNFNFNTHKCDHCK